MLMLFAGQVIVAKVIFGISLFLLLVSLALSLREVQISVDALSVRLSDLKKK